MLKIYEYIQLVTTNKLKDIKYRNILIVLFLQNCYNTLLQIRPINLGILELNTN